MIIKLAYLFGSVYLLGCCVVAIVLYAYNRQQKWFGLRYSTAEIVKCAILWPWKFIRGNMWD